MADAERCVCCGEIIPEGRQVCVQCILPLVQNVSEYDARKRGKVNDYHLRSELLPDVWEKTKGAE